MRQKITSFEVIFFMVEPYLFTKKTVHKFKLIKRL